MAAILRQLDNTVVESAQQTYSGNHIVVIEIAAVCSVGSRNDQKWERIDRQQHEQLGVANKSWILRAWRIRNARICEGWECALSE